MTTKERAVDRAWRALDKAQIAIQAIGLDAFETTECRVAWDAAVAHRDAMRLAHDKARRANGECE